MSSTARNARASVRDNLNALSIEKSRRDLLEQAAKTRAAEARGLAVARSLAPNMFDFGFIDIAKRGSMSILVLEMPDGTQEDIPLSDPMSGGDFADWAGSHDAIFGLWASAYVSAVRSQAERCRRRVVTAALRQLGMREA